jgi:hypothetical protein
MRDKRSARYKLIRGGLLAGSILSFIPAFALVRAPASADDESGGGTSPSAPVTATPAQPSRSQPSSTQPATPSQTRPRTTAPVQPRARTRAS